MRKTMVMVLFAAIMLLWTIPVSATVHVFNPDPADMFDLDHHYYYTWGLDWTYQEEEVYDVRLSFKNINNWDDTENSLFLHLLDNAPTGLTSGNDADNTISDYFAGQGILIDEWSDPDGGWNGPTTNLSYSFRDLGIVDDFSNFANDGNFGLGFDPDCHYWNDGVQLTVITDVPEPATIILFGIALAGGGLARKKLRK